MGKFSPTKLHGDCEEIANPSTAYGRRRRNWIDAHGSVPAGQVVDASCGNQRCIALQHAYLRPRVEQPGTYRKIADRVHRLKVGHHFDVRASALTRGAATDSAPACTRLLGWTRSRCAGSRTGACASRRSGSGRACELEAQARSHSASFELEKCTAFVLPICEWRGFLRLLRKIGNIVKTRVSIGFACILEKFKYDCFGGRNLRVWFESYLRSHSFSISL